MKNKTKTASDIPVYCSHSDLVDITTLVANPRNPNKHPDAQIAILAKVIRHQGWRSPIVVSRLSGFIVKGHGRFQAAKMLNVEKVPVDFQDYDTPAAEWADLIADNRIAELAETDNDLLKEILGEIKDTISDVELTGFSDSEINSWFENEMVLQGKDQERTPAERLDDYENSAIRQIMLIMNVEEFQEITDKLDVIKTQNDLTNNTEAALLAIREYANNHSPETPA